MRILVCLTLFSTVLFVLSMILDANFDIREAFLNFFFQLCAWFLYFLLAVGDGFSFILCICDCHLFPAFGHASHANQKWGTWHLFYVF